MGENTQSKFDLELEKIGITLNERQKQQFDKYYEMLVERNRSWFPGDSSEDCISASEGCTS